MKSPPLDALTLIASVAGGAAAASNVESALHSVTEGAFNALGERAAHLRPGALKAGEQQFFVAGVFLHDAARKEHVLVAEHGFPPEQHRLRIPDDLGHPGWILQHPQPLLLADTDEHDTFKQILKTSRMGSAMYAPMVARDCFLGQLIMAAQARGTMRPQDLDLLTALAQCAAQAFVAFDGPTWLNGLHEAPVP